ncbi:MAG: 1-acyl-sn-glycerol-3-phosphate acyltransferase [Clostridia bacterium]|nr:1-acyl-sn-glycerol-3-phosphate acyltransferase [Clostridia bacterium]
MNVILFILTIIFGIVFLPLFILGLLLSAFLSLFIGKDTEYKKDNGFYRALFNVLTWYFLTVLRVKVVVSGKELIKGDDRVLFVCNHISAYDPLITWLSLRDIRPAFVSKPENMKVPVFGRFVKKLLFTAIDRENPKLAIKTIVKSGERLKDKAVSVCIYPEGTRNREKGLLPFHNGVFKIAQKGESDILVATVYGTQDINKRLTLKRTVVHLDLISLLHYAEIKDVGTQEIGDRVKSLMEENLKKYN